MRRVVAALCCLALLGAAGCATSGGVEVAGRASQVSPPPPEPPLPSGTPVSADAVSVLRADPAVSAEVRAALVPCEGGGYPVNDRYTDLTGDGVAELVVTVFSCKIVKDAALFGFGSGFGLAAYVYDLSEDPPVNLLALQTGGVELLVAPERGLMALHSGYGPRDDPCCPTEEHLALYTWNGTALVESRK
ncbi:hypothetical protein [Actinophytocola xanthii]|uniref:Lipoprotein n=1 Tax=Actinophytocola xanthii TaxID=1912961 RepID=A0A1Q8CE08_9PSEU|nr:hypothetical protein [Actinophytocola xanthii]OLF12596.1 hypothetical protein BU204_28580 [Actinophytocola xanthii]